VNDKVATNIEESLSHEGHQQLTDGRKLVWVHDFQMLPVARKLALRYSEKQREKDYAIGMFWHIPIPAVDQWNGDLQAERAREILLWFSDYEVLGFHVEEYKKNYLDACKKFGVQHAKNIVIKPISVDVGGIRTRVQDILEGKKSFSKEKRNDGLDLHEVFGNPADIMQQTRKEMELIVCGFERCDDIKATIERLEAWLLLLKEDPKLFERRKIVEIIIRTRPDIEQYDKLYLDAVRLIGEINAESQKSLKRDLVTHVKDNVDPEDVLIAMTLADRFVVTSKADGYNMSCAEAVVVALQKMRGRVITSDRTGFYKSLKASKNKMVAVTGAEINEQTIAEALRKDLATQPNMTEDARAELLAYFDEHSQNSWIRTMITELVREYANQFETVDEEKSTSYAHHPPLAAPIV
jgi:trehalose-6-phosphate synthase